MNNRLLILPSLPISLSLLLEQHGTPMAKAETGQLSVYLPIKVCTSVTSQMT